MVSAPNAAASAAGYGGESVYVLRGDGKRLVRLTRRGHDRILAWLLSVAATPACPSPTDPIDRTTSARTLDTR